jgi:deazaflavin-dependent oxidoreductase (nitroreductase family)
VVDRRCYFHGNTSIIQAAPSGPVFPLPIRLAVPWRIGGCVQGLPVLLLTTTGRRTGKQRVTPLGYFKHGDDYVIIASNAGFETNPAWYHNLKSRPQVALQVRDEQLTAIAEPAEETLREKLWDQLVERAPGYKAYQKRTRRAIPIVLLHPVSGS